MMKAVGQKIYLISKWMLLIALVLLALINIGGRLALANAELFRDQIEQQLADYGIRGVALDNISAHWEGLQPVLTIQGGSLSIPGRSHALSVNSLQLRVKLLDSLMRGDLRLESFSSRIEKLVLVRDKKGAWWLNDIPLTAQQSISSALDIYTLFYRLPTFVDVDIRLIQLRDLRRGTDYLIQHGHLRSSRDRNQLSLKLDASLPSTLGSDFHLVLQGNAANQQLFVQAARLDLRELLQLTMVEKNYLKQARLDFTGWAQLNKFKLEQMVNQARVYDLEFASSGSAGPGYQFSLLQKLQHQQTAWQLSGQLKQLSRGAERLGDFKYQLAQRSAQTSTELWLNRMDVGQLSTIIQQLGLQDKQLDALQGASGELKNITAMIDHQRLEDSRLGFDFSQLSLKRRQNLPGFSDIDGRFVVAKNHARLQFSGDDLRIDFGDFFRTPLALGKVSASATARIDGDRRLLQLSQLHISNKDIKLDGRMWLEQQRQQRPFVFIRGQYRDGRISATGHYLPVKIMQPDVVEWLDRALRGGRIEQGDFIFHGRLQKPSQLQRERAGLLHASFKVANPRVDFLEQWPQISGGQGQVDFINAGLNLTFNNSRFVSSRIDKLQLAIRDFNLAGINLNAQTDSAADILIDTLKDLPGLETIKTFRQQARKISGKVASRLQMMIPLQDDYPQAFKISADATLKDVNIQAPAWMLALENIKGKLHIEDDRFSAHKITARYYGDPITLDISPQPDTASTRLDISGKLHSKNLLTLAPDFLRQPVSGVSMWNASLTLAHQPSASKPLLQVVAHSSLLGTRLDFPAPLAIAAKQQQRVEFSAALQDSSVLDFTLNMPDWLRTRGRIDLSPQSNRPVQFLNIGLQQNKLPALDQGIVLSGHTSYVDSRQWAAYINRYFAQGNAAEPPLLQQIKTVELDIDQLMIGNQPAQQAKLVLRNNGKLLQGYLKSSLAQGEFTLPYRMNAHNPLVAKLDYIRLKKTDSKQRFDPQIDDMPNLFIRSRKISFEQMEVDNFVLRTRNEGNTFAIEQLDFSRDKVSLKSSGHWQYEPVNGEHVSVFNISILGKNFGSVVKKLGLGETIQGGEVNFHGQIGWGGALFSMNWQTLIGEVNLTLKDGYLKNVDPGAGRFVGLLSFNALPKRLFLDFGDVVKDGMQFNKIKGRFSIKGEIMHTDNASLDSVSAKVRVKGDTNLRRKTYNQTMIITPKIGDTLPLLGALTAGNAVGWGLLLIQKIFKKPIDKSVQIEYKVSGSWDNPKIDLVAEKKLTSDKQENEIYDSPH